MLYHLFIIISIVNVYQCYMPNNVCKTLKDYNSKLFNKNCWYNPDADLSVPEVIRFHGYPLETYQVKTEDGYLLQMFRIPHGLKHDNITSRQPVFIQHGVLASCSPFVTCGTTSIGFRLADEGYDVWLGNSRGSTYGKGHVKLSLRDDRYWDFSFHEMGVYDVPSSLDVIAETTGRKDIIFIANSMGSCLPLVYATQLPKHASQRLKLIFHLAPTVFVGNVRTELRRLTYYEKELKLFSDLFGVKEILPMNKLTKKLNKEFCEGSAIQVLFCENLIFLIFGASNEFRPETLPLITGHFPAGTSVKTLFHLFQLHKSNNFRHYDYGLYKNVLLYNSSIPPDYDLRKVKIPNYIMYGTKDFVATEKDSHKLFNSLPNAIGLWRIDGFNHADFFYSKNVIPAVQNEMFRVLNSYKENV